MKASELIESMEQQAGCRVDGNNYDNMAMAGLFGAVARALGSSSHSAKDDVAAGLLVREQTSEAGRIKRERDDLLANMLTSGVSPDDIAGLQRAISKK